LKVTVAHLFKKLEEIDRDVVELQKLDDRIAKDREYSPILKESFQQERQKLSDQRIEILKLNVDTTSYASKAKESLKKVETESKNKPPADATPQQSEAKKNERPVRKY